MKDITYKVDKGISDKYDLPKDKKFGTKDKNNLFNNRGVNYVACCSPDSIFYGIYGNTYDGEIKPVGVITEENAQLIKESTMNHFPKYANLPPIDYYLEISKKGHDYFSQFKSLTKVECSYEEAKDLYDSILNRVKD
ncbi:MAG: hypothetical protein WC260_00785 [Candidatus Pacearchaeota archaeon]